MTRFLIILFSLIGIVVIGFVLTLVLTQPDIPAKDRAVVLMMASAAAIWIFGCGSLMWIFRDAIKRIASQMRHSWTVMFVVFATLLACVEEALTTLMTNLAPQFGSTIGEAYITASTNYFEVIFLHSVIVFVPNFIAWALLLKRYAFTPAQVFLLYGLTGMLAEAFTFGPQAFTNVGLWMWIYGLMVWLPAYAVVPQNRGARPVRFWHIPLALILPVLFALPVVFILISLGVPQTHF